MRNLVMGLAKGYNWYILEPFVRSFIKNVPSANLVLFTGEMSPFTRNRLENIGGGRIKIEPYPDYAKNARPVNIRWKICIEYIKAHEREYNQILMADTRDVIFQSDIFKEFESQSNYLGYATEGDNIKGEKSKCDLNYIWMTEGFGKEAADKLADKEIICGGTVIGTPKEMQIFGSKVLEYIPSLTHGHEQMTLQYMIYNKLLPIENLIKISYYDGAIFTTSLYAVYNQIKTESNFILSPNGRIPAVVHQYDRPQKELNDFVERIYRQKDFKFDGRFVDIESIFDQIPSLVYSENWKDLLTVFVIYFMDNKSYFYNKTDFSVSNAGNPYRKFGGYLLTVWQKILTTKNLSPEVEALEVILQRALIESCAKEISPTFFIQLCNLTSYAIKNNRIVSSLLKKFMYGGLMNFANNFVGNNDFQNAEVCLNYITELNITLNQEFYILQAKIYRKLKKKEEAAAAYQKALELE